VVFRGGHRRFALAKDAGIPVNRGIVVDDCLQTGAPDIFALGACASIVASVRPGPTGYDRHACWAHRAGYGCYSAALATNMKVPASAWVSAGDSWRG